MFLTFWNYKTEKKKKIKTLATIIFLKQNIVFLKKGPVLQQFHNTGILPGPG